MAKRINNDGVAKSEGGGIFTSKAKLAYIKGGTLVLR